MWLIHIPIRIWSSIVKFRSTSSGPRYNVLLERSPETIPKRILCFWFLCNPTLCYPFRHLIYSSYVNWWWMDLEHTRFQSFRYDFEHRRIGIPRKWRICLCTSSFIIEYSENQSQDTGTYLLGDLDSTSGTGNEIRFYLESWRREKNSLLHF